MLSIFGETIEVTDSMECGRGVKGNGDHRKLVLDARVDCLDRSFNPESRFVLCGRCSKAISLKI